MTHEEAKDAIWDMYQALDAWERGDKDAAMHRDAALHKWALFVKVIQKERR